MYIQIWLLMSFATVETAIVIWAMAKFNNLLLQIHDQEATVSDCLQRRSHASHREAQLQRDLAGKEAQIQRLHFELNSLAGRPSMTHNVLDGSPIVDVRRERLSPAPRSLAVADRRLSHVGPALHFPV